MLEGGARDPALRDACAHRVHDPLHLVAAQASIRLGLRLGAGLRCHLSVPLCVDETSNTGARVYLSRPAVPAAKRCYSVAAGAGAAVVCDVYSNSSSAPNRRSRTAFRRSSLRAIAKTPATMPIRKSLRSGWRFFLRLPWMRSEASLRFSAAVRRSRWTFLSSVTAR